MQKFKEGSGIKSYDKNTFKWYAGGRYTKLTDMSTTFKLKAALHCLNRANHHHKESNKHTDEVDDYMAMFEVIKESLEDESIEVPDTPKAIKKLIGKIESGSKGKITE